MSISRAKKRQNKSAIFNWKIISQVVLFTIFAGCCYWLSVKTREIKYFPIKEVQIHGAERADHDAIQDLLISLVNVGFFSVDLDLIKERLQQSPWVAKAAVQRIWPDKIVIDLQEREAIGRWNHTGLLSSSGEVFNPPQTSFPEHLPDFVGPETEQIQMLQYYFKINNLFLPLHFKISRLELTPSNSWELTFDNGMKLTMGNKDILTRITHFVKVYPKIVANHEGEIEHVDLRYPNGLAVRWKTIT